MLAQKLSYLLCKYLRKKQIINSSDFDCYVYSFDFVFDLLLFVLSLLIISLFFSTVTPTIVFILTLTPLRMLAGGVHASSRLICSIVSYITYFICILILKTISFTPPFLLLPLGVFFSLCIIFFAPVDTANKRIREHAIRLKYKKRCILTFIFLTPIFVLSFFFWQNTFYIMLFCYIIVLTSQIIGLINNIRLENHNE